ncbi:MAG: bifunctional phosphoribosylaminoimidazolecarboxamide formyltransferase/IMP cyclohydrolase [Planctomycetota bacterium]
MAERKIKRALIAVYDKTGITEFARALVDEFGIEIISTGGTAKHLKDAGIPVTMVEEVTGFPEMLDGRVKTLHPKIHAAILADRDNPEHMRQLAEHGIKPIDMVVVNLYPFEKTVADPNCTMDQAIEMIDIGGPCMLRAAAKNHKHVLVVSASFWYDSILRILRGERGVKSLADEMRDAAFHVFGATEEYDAAIWEWLGGKDEGDFPVFFARRFFSWGSLAYGENRHQTGRLVSLDGMIGSTNFGVAPIQQRGRFQHEEIWELSYNNFGDADAAHELCSELTRAGPKPTCLFIKHTNACGVGVADDTIEAYRRAYLGDVNAAMGGILAVSFPVNAEFVDAVMHSLDRWGKAAGAGAFFVEVWVAPSFDEDAVKLIRSAKKWGENVRLLAVGEMTVAPDPDQLEYKTIAGGMLVQSRDNLGLNEDQWKVVTKRAPTESEMSDLRLAWLIAKHTKSNAISICEDGMLIGNGAGQMSRVMSCRIATWLAKENGHADKLAGSAAASDAFFPFRDGPDILMDAGVTAIIQPGGSKRDEDTIKACDERGVAMIFTGTRHFKH